jgi:predicted TIM-barrel fold metal-dependent hydrolase
MTDLVDAHASVGPYPRAYTDSQTPAEFATAMRRLGIGTAVVASTAAVWHDPVGGNGEALAAGRVPGLLPCLTVVPPTPGELDDPAALVRDGIAAGGVAVRIHPATHDFDPLDPALDPFYDTLVANGLPLTVDVPDVDWPIIDQLAGRWPALPVIVSAIGYRALRRLAAVFRRRPNLHADTVNFATHEGWEWFVRHFGAERLLFATGAPLRDPAEAVARLRWSRLSEADRRLVGHGNAARLFRGVA